jgi:hypothetical protein
MKTIRKVIAALALSAVVSGCYGHDKKKVADTNTNWLDCESNDDCDDSLMCIEGVCSKAPREDAGAGPRDDDAGELPPPPARVGLAFDGEPMLLSDPEGGASVPKVSSLDGGWVVVWQTPGSDPANPDRALGVVELDDEGVVDSREIVLPDTDSSSVDLVGLSSDREASVLMQSRSEFAAEMCTLRFVHVASGDAKDMGIPCKGGQAFVADIADSSKWLIAATKGADVLVGVYESSNDWVAPLTAIGQRDDTAPIALSSDGKAASVVWGNGATSRAFGIADVDRPAMVTSVTRRDGAVNSEGPYTVEQLDDRAIAVGIRGTGLWSSVLRAGTATPSVQVAHGRGYDDRPSIARTEDGELLAVCYSATDGAGPLQGLLVVIDREGRPVAERMVLAEETWSGRGCDLAWFGDTLLVAWPSTTFEPNVGRKDFVRARRIILTR